MEKAKKKTIEDYPELLKEWHPTKNGELQPGDFTYGSGKKVWWICEEGHEWEAVVAARVIGRGICENCKSLEFLYPEIAKEWNSNKNMDLTADKVFSHSRKKVWWQCERGHEWEAIVSGRTSGRGCPYCSGRKLLPEKSIASMYPDIAKEWHPTKNSDLTPYKVSSYSAKKVWWRCKKHHEWKTRVSSRTLGNGCPDCNAGNKISFPELCIYFYICQVAPDAVSQYVMPKSRKSLDIFIPSINLAIEYDGAYFHQESQRDLAKDELIKETMGDTHLIRVREFDCPVYTSSNPLVSFYILDQDANTLSIIIRQIVERVAVHLKKDSVPTINISGDEMAIYQLLDRLEVEGSLLELFPEVAKEWHPSKNGQLTPVQFSPGSNRKAWWLCSSGHEWMASVFHRKNGSGCPYCSGNYVSSKNSLVQRYPELAAEFHTTKNTEITVDKLSFKSNKIVWWKCSHGKSWKAEVGKRTRRGFPGNPSCEECTPVNYLIDEYPKIAKEFHPTKNGEIIVNDLSFSSGKKVWWQCKHGFCWEAKVHNRTTSGKTGHHSCPSCRVERKQQKAS